MSIETLLNYEGPHKAVTHADIVSDKYNFISTERVLRGLNSAEWGVAEFLVNRVRKNGREGFQKHAIKLQRFDSIGKPEAPQILLINSHDRSSGFKIALGVFRLVCSNGLVIGNDMGFSVRHIGGSPEKVIDAVYSVINDMGKIHEKIDALKSIELTQETAEQFGEEALKLRFDFQRLEILKSQFGPQISGAWAQRARRLEDSQNTLWNVFNRVQENLINKTRVRGGRSISGLTSIDSSTKFNRELWELAEKFLKEGA